MGWKHHRKSKHTTDPAQRAADVADGVEKRTGNHNIGYWLQNYREALDDIEEVEKEKNKDDR